MIFSNDYGQSVKVRVKSDFISVKTYQKIMDALLTVESHRSIYADNEYIQFIPCKHKVMIWHTNIFK